MKKTFIIAEAGVNHNGDINLAKKMINAAVEAGANAVKFQTFKTEKLVSKKAVKAVIYTSKISKQLKLDLAKHNAQYPKISIKTYEKSHDRFLIMTALRKAA